MEAFVSLGSNTDDARAQLCRALEALAALPGVGVAAQSPVYRTEPQELRAQPWFCNQVVALACAPAWTAQALLSALLEVEKAQGRVRSADPALRFGPRCIDLDLLLFGQECHHEPNCTVPHPRMLYRAFVLVPLRDVAPQVILPNGKTPGQTLDALRYHVLGDIIRQ